MAETAPNDAGDCKDARMHPHALPPKQFWLRHERAAATGYGALAPLFASGFVAAYLPERHGIDARAKAGLTMYANVSTFEVHLRNVTVRIEGPAASLKAFRVPKSDTLQPGAVLNHGTHNADGSWTLGANDLSGLTVTPPTGKVIRDAMVHAGLIN